MSNHHNPPLVQIEPCGDTAVSLKLGHSISPDVHRQVMALVAAIEELPFPGWVECVPYYTGVTVYYDPMEVVKWRQLHPYYEPGPEALIWETVASWIREKLHQAASSPVTKPRTVEIPVCYGGICGPDLQEVAQYTGLTADEVIAIHSGATYLVYMLGFAPGFPYLGGLPECLATPRRATPRLQIPSGSVGIAGQQTGVYPLPTPGGWQLIGRTPVRLFQPLDDPPTMLQPGDQVRFVPISWNDYEAYEEENKS